MIITIHLQGGLGNQLFQIFVTMAYAIQYNCQFIFPYAEQLGSRQTYWNSFLSRLKPFTTFLENKNIINASLVSTWNLQNKYQVKVEHESNTDTLSVDYKLRHFPLFREQGFEYREIPTFYHQSMQLFGYFQSYLYFESYRETLFDWIGLKQQQASLQQQCMNDEELKHIWSDYSVSMHFRLGDYKNLPDYHPVMPYEYYEKALIEIISHREQNQPRIIYVFGEREDVISIERVIHRLRRRFSEISFIKVDDSIEDWKQMLLMSQCRDHIIANSTFSWWGAYFDLKLDKIVCYPETWFGVKMSHNTSNLCPRSWVKIIV
jgi:hypothetical protein